MKRYRYDDEKLKFVSKYFDTCTYSELADKFNYKFGTNVSAQAMSDLCNKSLKLKKTRNNGMFSSRLDRPFTRSVGTEVWRCGYIFVKTNDVRHEGSTSYSDMSENWQPKHRVIYENTYGKIPNDKIVIFLDNDRTNFNIDNLYCIDRKINLMMNNFGLMSNNPEITLTAIKWCELNCAMK